MRFIVVGAMLALGACQPLYGNKPEALHKLDKKKRPAEADVKDAPIKYIEECTASFQDDPKKPQWKSINTNRSNQSIEAGDTAQQLADKAKDPATKVAGIKAALEKYREALTQDPYNAQATLKLALEYDLLLRKGCAIAMLKRLSSLTNNPKFARGATAAIDSIGDNAAWFKGYRKDAMAAVGR
jgi:hypothetical protein